MQALSELPEILPPEDGLVPITAAVHPLRIGREIVRVKPGKSLRAVVDDICPAEFIDQVCITVNGNIVGRDAWDLVQIKDKDVVVVRAVPQGGSGLKSIERSVLSLAVMAVAFAVAGPLGGAIAGALGVTGAVGTALISAGVVIGVNAIGQLAINALIPPSQLNPTGYNFGSPAGNGITNVELQYGVVPVVMGRTIMTPPLGAHSYTEFSGNNTWLYCLFDLGPGPLNISNIKLGQTPIDDFADVTYNVYEGRDTDGPLQIYTNQISVPTPQPYITLSHHGDNATLETGLNVNEVEVDIAFPGGLFNTNGNGTLSNCSIQFNVAITNVVTNAVINDSFTISGASTSNVGDTYIRRGLPAGQYSVQIEYNSDPPDSNHGSAVAIWSGFRYRSPLSGPLLPVTHAKIELSIKATEQLNGVIQNLNCIAQRYVQVWNGSTFTEELNTHPAWAAYTVLTGEDNARPLDSSQIDLTALYNWAQTYPEAEFNYVFGSRTTIWQALRTIGSAGRGLPVIRDGLYSFVFDYTQDSPVQLFTTRNISKFTATRNLFDEIQGMEIRYISETLGWQQYSVYTYASGITPENVDLTKVSPLNLTGVTSDDWAYKLGTYFFAAAVLRATTYSFDTDLDHLACNIGDRVWVQHDVVSAGIIAGRITGISRDGSNRVTSVTLDEQTIGDGTSTYSVIVRTQTGGMYTVPVTVATSETKTFATVSPYVDSSDPFNIGDLVVLATTEIGVLDAIVKTISPKPNFQATVTLLDYAPAVHNGDSTIPPVVTNTYINKFIQALPTCSVVIDSLAMNETTSLASSNGGALIPQIQGHLTVQPNGLPPTKFEVQYQVDGQVGWQAIADLPPSMFNFYIPLSTVSVGLTYNVRARGNNTDGTDPSAWYTASITIADFSVLPPAPTSLTITPIINGVTAAVVTGGYTSTAQYKLYANTADDFSTAQFVGSSTTTPFNVNGLSAGTVYFFWATTVNGAGVESDPSSAVSAIPLPAGYYDFLPEVTQFVKDAGNRILSLEDAVNQLNVAAMAQGLGAYNDYTTVTTNIADTAATLTTGYESAITAATGPSSAIVTDINSIEAALSGYLGANAVSTAVNSLQTQVTVNAGNISTNAANISTINSALSGYLGASAVSNAVNSLQTQVTTNAGNITTAAANITSLQSALSGYTGANAVANAVSSLQTQITTANGNISANASSISSLSTEVGNFYASGLFRVDVGSTPSGANSRIEISVAASGGGSTYTAAMFLDAMTSGVSRITLLASELYITDGTNVYSPFYFSGGTAYLQNAVIQNLSAAVLTAGTLNVGTVAISGTVTTATVASNAITNSAVATGGSNSLSGTFSTVAQVTITTQGGNVLIQFMDYDTWTGSAPAVYYQVLRDGSVLFGTQGGGGSAVPASINIAGGGLDTGASGASHTYALQAKNIGGTVTSANSVIVATELKR